MKRILIYGATGYSGQIIAARAAQRQHDPDWDPEVSFALAGLEADVLAKLSAMYGFQCKPFALNERDVAVNAVRDFDVILNAAGPFTRTASRLAKAALDAHCHYVDLNDSVDVYQGLDDLAPFAWSRGLALVSGAGWMATAADLLFRYTHDDLTAKGPLAPRIKSVRVAFARSPWISRGSALTMAQSVREEVTVIRSGRVSHLPVGAVERRFHFPVGKQEDEERITCAVNLLDSLVLNRTAWRLGLTTLDIESHLEMRGAERLAYQLAAFGAIAMYLPFAQRALVRQLAALPEGPSAQQRSKLRSALALTIEDEWQRALARWVLDAPNFYDFSANSALEVAVALAQVQPVAGSELSGWITPSMVLSRSNPLANWKTGDLRPPFQGCVLRSLLPQAMEASHG